MSPDANEDLIREATALTKRIEVGVDDEVWIWGRRSNGSISLFCGSAVFQFNSANQIRRAFVKGHRIKAQAGELVQLDRTTRGGSIHFSETLLDPEAKASLLDNARHAVMRFAVALKDRTAVPRGVGGDIDLLCQQAQQWSQTCLARPLEIAERPHAN